VIKYNLLKDNFEVFNYINQPFLTSVLWQIKKPDFEMQKEIENKMLQMIEIAKEIDTVAYIFEMHKKAEQSIFYQVVSLGEKAVEISKDFNNRDEYSDYFYWHGFCAALTEATAEYVHNIIKKDYPTMKKRLSWGYPALPDITEQIDIIKLLKAEEIGVSTTESGMLSPEYSTCAMVF
jgi:cobalamin-dependent methionine synthase I